MPLEVLVDSQLRIKESDLSPAMSEQVDLSFSYVNPEPLPPSARGEDATWTRPKWSAVSRRDGFVCLPRGLTEALRNIARGCGVDLAFKDRMTWDRTRARVPVGDLAVVPREYQLEAHAEIAKRVQGYVVLPCGGGKTTLGSTSVLHLNQSSLVLVGSVDLLDQWDGALIRGSAGKVRPRLIGGGSRVDLRPLRPGEVAVATVQSLYDRPDIQPFLDSVAILLGDEIHHVPCRQFRYVVDRCAARWRLGLSATPDRSDGWGFLLRVLLGPMLFRRTSRELVDLGFLQCPTIIPVRSEWGPGPAEYRWRLTCSECGFKGEHPWGPWQRGEAQCQGKRRVTGPRGGVKLERCSHLLEIDCEARQGDLDWGKTSTALFTDGSRQHLLATLARAAVGTGRRVLMLVGRKAGLEDIAGKTGQGGVRVAAVSSKTSARDERIGAFRAGKLDVLIATSLADEGLDVPELDCVVLGQPGKDPGKARQRSGRTTRPQGKPAVVFDVVDRGDTMSRHWSARKKAYVEEYGERCLGAPRPVSVDEAVAIMRRLG